MTGFAIIHNPPKTKKTPRSNQDWGDLSQPLTTVTNRGIITPLTHRKKMKMIANSIGDLVLVAPFSKGCCVPRVPEGTVTIIGDDGSDYIIFADSNGEVMKAFRAVSLSGGGTDTVLMGEEEINTPRMLRWRKTATSYPVSRRSYETRRRF